MILRMDPFIASLEESLEELAEVKVTSGAPEAMSGDETLSEICIAIYLEDQPEDTFFLLSGDLATARNLTTKITGKDDFTGKAAGLVTDTVGEILNILIGIAQRKSNTSFNFSLPVPIDGNMKVTDVFKAKYKQSMTFFEGGQLMLYMLTSGKEAIAQQKAS